LEWAREATEANPRDPMAFGHFANALIDAQHYEEAEKALDVVAQRGDPLFAANGRARILRDLGRVADARAAFLATARQYDQVPGVVHSWLGAAEALRELGDSLNALHEYQELSHRWPDEVSVWNGLASAQIDLGMISEAFLTFSTTTKTNKGALARAGKANLLRLLGQLDRALSLYDAILVDYPNDRFALCGRGEVLQDQGKLVEALSAFELAIERSPYRADPILGKARILRRIGHFDEAAKVYEHASRRFPADRRIATGLVALYRAQGRFDESLIAVDKQIAENPFDARPIVVRAAILSRLGKDEEALELYNDVLKSPRVFARAAIGKAALLIKLKRCDEATLLLPEQKPSTRNDWRRFLLRAFLIEDQKGARAASEVLARYIPLCPFASERRRMRDLLATLELRRNRFSQARYVVESNPDEVSNVVALHVLAATLQTSQAQSRLARLRQSEGPIDVINLAEEIARRHRLSGEQPRYSIAWVEAAETNIMLAEAA
jgi:tetratricopeptide (TPR) repeat protein